jgi:hypothetical protein
MDYIITSLCIGSKYEPILPKWIKRINEKCKNCEIKIINNANVLDYSIFTQNYHGYIWALRFKYNLDLLINSSIPIVMCDIDVIVEKDLEPIINLPYDIIISKEIGGSDAYPTECSNKLGFGVCCGFMIWKPSSKEFMLNIFDNMYRKKYNTYDDQVNIMKYIVDSNYNVTDKEVILDGIKYNNKIIEIDNIKICVLDFDIIIRDPIIDNGQFANHINIDNVGGTDNFLKHFDNSIEDLPLTCRCGKTHLGNYEICNHINIRNN